MRGRAGQTDAREAPRGCGDELVDLVPHQQTAVAGLGPLAVLDLDGAGVFLHLGQGVDDLIPAEISAGDLQDHVFQEAGPQQPRRAAAFAGAETDRHAQLFVQIGHPHLQTLPHGGGEGAEGHAADDQRVDFPDRRDPAVLPADLERLFRRQDTPQQGSQLEFMAAGIQSRVGQHGDAHELDFVQQASGDRSAVPRAGGAGRPR